MRKRKKRIRKIIVRLIALLIVLGLIGAAFFGLYRLVVNVFFDRRPAQEDETLFLSPPSEEILFVRPGEGIFIAQDTQGRTIQQLTNAHDFAPSWKQDGSGFYFLRKTPANELHLMFYNYLQGQLGESSIQTFSPLEIPNPDNDTIKISPDGSLIAVSSYDWGLQVFEVSSKKVVSRSFEQCWEFWDIFSRNSKFCLLATRPHPQPLQLVHGAGTSSQDHILYFATTDLRSLQHVDSSSQPFQGMSFSRNGYTFAYAKEGSIYYVDTIQNIQPQAIIDGIQPAIRQVSDPRKYRLIRPFWADFEVSNLVDILKWEEDNKAFLVLGTPGYLALADLSHQSIWHFSENRRKEQRLGWKMMDFFLADINNNSRKELIASWWSGGNSEGAERISIFSLDSSAGKMNEIFRTQGKYHNTLQITDLNENGINDLLNMYSDVSGEGNMALDALIWTDVYTWDGSKYQLNNERFSHVYFELAESYRAFLIKALRNPDHYGSDLYLIRELLERANAIIANGKMR